MNFTQLKEQKKKTKMCSANCLADLKRERGGGVGGEEI